MFYDRYDQLCKQKGVSKSAAAAEAGFTKSLVSKWKANKVEVPSPDILHRLSVYFNMPVSEILGEEQKENPGTTMDAEVSPLKAELLGLVDNATDEQLQDYLDMLRIVLNRREKR